MRNDKIEWIVGNGAVKVCPLPPYSEPVVAFLDDVAGELRKAAQREHLADVQALAFWCRKGNILRLKEQAAGLENSLGRGLMFHITPSNVPVNFAFSYFFGILSGNANIVRIPSRHYKQVDIICKAIGEVLNKVEYKIIKDGTAFVRYAHDKEITDRFSAMADGRIIWGGDEAIDNIRSSPLKPKGVEVVFADRYSLGIIDSSTVLKASEKEVQQLVRNFYNDTYLMDQNACSTPHLLLWLDSADKMATDNGGNINVNGNNMNDNRNAAKNRFWNAVVKEAARYDLEPIKVVDKYTALCIQAMDGATEFQSMKCWGNLLYTIDMKIMPKDICSLRGQFGMFYQCDIDCIQQFAPCINERVQTVLYYGVEKQAILDCVKKNHLMGVDRIVPFGQSLELTVYWDGYDIIGQLSRRIQVE